jgi:uncharacterized protein
MQQTYLQSLVGGGLIGLSAAILLLLNGRIAGVSGMVSGAVFTIAMIAGVLAHDHLFKARQNRQALQ